MQGFHTVGTAFAKFCVQVVDPGNITAFAGLRARARQEFHAHSLYCELSHCELFAGGNCCCCNRCSKANYSVVYVLYQHQFVAPVCSWEDYVGQVEMATAIAAFKAEQGDDPKPTAPDIGDRKELKKLQEVSLANMGSSHLH